MHANVQPSQACTLESFILTGCVTEPHCAKIHWVLDDFMVVRRFLWCNWFTENSARIFTPHGFVNLIERSGKWERKKYFHRTANSTIKPSALAFPQPVQDIRELALSRIFPHSFSFLFVQCRPVSHSPGSTNSTGAGKAGLVIA